MDQFRELRFNKIAIDMLGLLSELTKKSKSQEEVADIFSAWATVLGMAAGQLKGAKPESINMFLKVFDDKVKAGFLKELEKGGR